MLGSVRGRLYCSGRPRGSGTGHGGRDLLAVCTGTFAFVFGMQDVRSFCFINSFPYWLNRLDRFFPFFITKDLRVDDLCLF